MITYLKHICFIFFLLGNQEVHSFSFEISQSCKNDHYKCNDSELEYLAISELHDQIDDDKNGDIDLAESNYFVKGSLSYKHGSEKAKKFHKSDDHINKQELWDIWKANEVYNWTTIDLINWLKLEVELPQYEQAFSSLKLNGSSLSRLTGMYYLTHVVKIQNPIHRKKIMIKAVDVVLFGSQKKYQFSNRSIIITLLFFIAIITYLVIENLYSKRFVKTMQDKLKDLSSTEESLTELRKKLQVVEEIKNQQNNEILQMEERHKYEISQVTNSSRESLSDENEKSQSQKEIAQLKKSLFDAQCQIDQLIRKSSSISFNKDSSIDARELHLLLQLTHAIELQNLTERINSIDCQSTKFIELVWFQPNGGYTMPALKNTHPSYRQKRPYLHPINEKVKKKKAAFLGSFRLIHSTDMDDIEKGFAATKRSYEKIIYDKRELELRWNQLENLTGFNLTKGGDVTVLRQLLLAHSESIEHHKRLLCSSVPVIQSTNESIDNFLIHSKSVPNENSQLEKIFQMSDRSSHRNSGDSSENPSWGLSTVDPTEDTILTKRLPKEHPEKKRKLFKLGRT